jgi:lambda family phage tail tape measure protein
MASDVSVTLSLDDSQYTNKLKTAETAAKLFGTTSNTAFNSAKGGVANLSTSLEGLSSKFSGLGTMIASIGMGALITNMLKSADALDDMAASLGVDTARLQEMGMAAGQAGSDLEKLGAMMTKLEQNTQSAIEGDDKLQGSFEKLKISAGDIKTLAPDELFYKVAKSLSEIQDPAERTAAGIDLLGKGFKGMDPGSFVKSIDQLYGSFEKYKESQKAAAAVTQQLEMQMGLVKNEFLSMLTPILNFVSAFSGVNDQFNIAKVLAVGLGIALVGIVGNSVLSGFKFLSEIVSGVATAFGGATTATNLDSVAMDANAAAILRNSAARSAQSAKIAMDGALNKAAAYEEAAATAASAGQIKNAEMALRNMTSAKAAAASEAAKYATATKLAGVENYALATSSTAVGASATGAGAAGAASGAGAAVGAVGWRAYATSVGAAAVAMGAMMLRFTAIALVVAGVVGAIQIVGKALIAWKDGTDVVAAASDNFLSKTIAWGVEATKSFFGVKGATDDSAKATGSYADAIKDAEEKQKKLTEEQQKFANSEAVKGINAQTASIRQLTQSMQDQQTASIQRATNELAAAKIMIGANDQQTNAAKRYLDTYLNNIDAINKANQDKAKIALEVAKLEDQLKDTKLSDNKRAAIIAEISAYNDQMTKIDDLVAGATKLKDLEYERKGAIELQNQLLGIQEKSSNMIKDLNKESQQMTMNSDQKRMNDIQWMAQAEKDAAIKAFEAAAGRKATSQEIATINDKIAVSYGEIYTTTGKVINQSHEFKTGWNKALNEYAQAAGDSAGKANELFTKGTKGMEDAIVGLAKTGKFEWKNLLSDMLETLLRWGIQKIFTQIMGDMGGQIGALGGLLGGGGGSGSAGGGQARSSGGSSGGSSSGGLGDLIKGIGNLFSGGGSKDTSSSYSDPYAGGGDYSGYTTGSYDNYGSSYDVGSQDTLSYGEEFVGYYAKGGLIPAGKYGIAGEKGAELISGPATVTPLDKLGGSTQITIYANDALSFKQMLAKDPSFLSALVMQGNKGIPGAR